MVDIANYYSSYVMAYLQCMLHQHENGLCSVDMINLMKFSGTRQICNKSKQQAMTLISHNKS